MEGTESFETLDKTITSFAKTCDSRVGIPETAQSPVRLYTYERNNYSGAGTTFAFTLVKPGQIKVERADRDKQGMVSLSLPIVFECPFTSREEVINWLKSKAQML